MTTNTQINYKVLVPSDIALEIFDLTGKNVKTWLMEENRLEIIQSDGMG